MSDTTSKEQVVSESDAMARSHLVDFMFAVAVECCPLDLCGGCLIRSAPVEDNALTGSAGVADGQVATLVRRRQRNDQAADLVFASRSVDVWLELAIRSAVDIELVELSLCSQRSAQGTRNVSQSMVPTLP